MDDMIPFLSYITIYMYTYIIYSSMDDENNSSIDERK